MKEDAQLICPISYHDTTGSVWGTLQQSILDRLPLRDISWKTSGTISSSQTAVDKLPLRFMPSTASLFKDTDHPFRWFLAPYANIYFVNVDNLESYRELKITIKKWVETMVGLKRASWLLVYAPTVQGEGTPAPDAVSCSKVYTRLSSDFYVERAGDRSVNFMNITIPPKISEESKALAYADFFSKVKEGIVFSFFQRCAQYDSDIRRLDSFRGSSQFDFRQLFLVKESLALMYQLMQLPQEALRQYGELEALLSVIPLGTLPNNNWPLSAAEDLKATFRGASAQANTEVPFASSLQVAAVDEAGKSVCAATADILDTMWQDPMGEGENVLLYSINSARMRILKNKIGIRELKRYLFARQVHFLAQQHKGRECAVKGLLYVTDTYANIVSQLPVTKSLVCARRWQADLWALTAAVRIVRSCRMYVAKQQEQEQREWKSQSTVVADMAGITAKEIREREVESRLSSGLDPVPESPVGIQRPVGERETQLLRDASLPLGELLQLAIGKLHSISASLASHPSSRTGGPSQGIGEVTEGTSAIPLGDLYLIRTESSPFYRQQALSLSRSLHPPHSSLESKYDSSMRDNLQGEEISHGVIENNCDIALLQLVRTTVESVSKSVEDALQTDLDRALGIFSTHLRSLLTKGPLRRVETEGPSPLPTDTLKLDPSLESPWSLWCPLFVMLLRAIASHEDLVGRSRIAARPKLECADVLLCHGYYRLAISFYSSATPGLMEGGLSVEAQPDMSWDDLKRATLLKIIYCSAAVGDRCGHMSAAILLRNLQLQGIGCTKRSSSRFYVIGHCSSNNSDNESGSSPTKHLSPLTRHSPWQEKQRSVESHGTDGILSPANLLDITQASSIHSFSLYFVIANIAVVHNSYEEIVTEIHSGGSYTLHVQLLSLFPCTVQIDDMSVLYLLQEPPHLGAFSNPVSLSSSPSHLSPHSLPSPSFTALYSSSDGDMMDAGILTLIPGVSKILSLALTAPRDRGNYVVNEIKVSVKSKGDSIVFVGDESEWRLTSGTVSATTPISVALPPMTVTRTQNSSLMEQKTGPNGDLLSMEGDGLNRNPNSVCAIEAQVHRPLFLPPQMLLVKRRPEVEMFQQLPKASQQDTDVISRAVIIQVELTNTSLSAAIITAVRLCNPQFLLTDIAPFWDEGKSVEREMEIFMVRSPFSPPVSSLCPTGMESLGSLEPGSGSKSGSVLLLPGETYCGAFEFLLREIIVDPLWPTAIIASSIGAAAEAVGLPEVMIHTVAAPAAGSERAVAKSFEKEVSSTDAAPALVYTFEGPAVGGSQFDLVVPLLTSLLHLSDALEKSCRGSGNSLTHAPLGEHSTLTAIHSPQLESENDSNRTTETGEGEREGARACMWGDRVSQSQKVSRRVLTKAVKAEDSAVLSSPLWGMMSPAPSITGSALS